MNGRGARFEITAAAPVGPEASEPATFGAAAAPAPPATGVPTGPTSTSVDPLATQRAQTEPEGDDGDADRSLAAAVLFVGALVIVGVALVVARARR